MCFLQKQMAFGCIRENFFKKCRKFKDTRHITNIIFNHKSSKIQWIHKFQLPQFHETIIILMKTNLWRIISRNRKSRESKKKRKQLQKEEGEKGLDFVVVALATTTCTTNLLQISLHCRLHHFSYPLKYFLSISLFSLILLFIVPCNPSSYTHILFLTLIPSNPDHIERLIFDLNNYAMDQTMFLFLLEKVTLGTKWFVVTFFKLNVAS